MTDISMTRGDSWSRVCSFLEADGVTPWSLVDAVLRMAIKESLGQTNAEAVVMKYSYRADEIEVLAPASNGQCAPRLRPDDTADVAPGRYLWELEATRKRGSAVTSAGSLAFTTGSNVAQATGVEWENLRVGQIITPTGALSGNASDVVVTAVDEGLGTITFEGYDAFTTEAGVAFSAFDTDRQTPDGFKGKWTIEPDVVRA